MLKPDIGRDVPKKWGVFTLFITGSMFLFAPTAQAQFHLGVEAGASVSRFLYDGYYYYDSGAFLSYSDVLHRFTVGLKAEYSVDDDMHISSGIRFAQRGGQYNIRTYDYMNGLHDSEGPYTIEYDYIEIPLGVKVFLNEKPVRLFIGMNGVMAINTRAESLGPDTIEEPYANFSSYSRDVLPIVDLLAGLQFSLGSEFAIYLEARYSRSVLSVDDAEQQNVYASDYFFTSGVMFRVFE